MIKLSGDLWRLVFSEIASNSGVNNKVRVYTNLDYYADGRAYWCLDSDKISVFVKFDSDYLCEDEGEFFSKLDGFYYSIDINIPLTLNQSVSNILIDIDTPLR